jgi:hypothetical protein
LPKSLGIKPSWWLMSAREVSLTQSYSLQDGGKGPYSPS